MTDSQLRNDERTLKLDLVRHFDGQVDELDGTNRRLLPDKRGSVREVTLVRSRASVDVGIGKVVRLHNRQASNAHNFAARRRTVSFVAVVTVDELGRAIDKLVILVRGHADETVTLRDVLLIQSLSRVKRSRNQRVSISTGRRRSDLRSTVSTRNRRRGASRKADNLEQMLVYETSKRVTALTGVGTTEIKVRLRLVNRRNEDRRDSQVINVDDALVVLDNLPDDVRTGRVIGRGSFPRRRALCSMAVVTRHPLRLTRISTAHSYP